MKENCSHCHYNYLLRSLTISATQKVIRLRVSSSMLMLNLLARKLYGARQVKASFESSHCFVGNHKIQVYN